MSILAWFRGLFGKPTKKRQRVENKRYIKLNELPPIGILTEQNARRLIETWPNVSVKQIARKLNQMGYLTPRGKKWRENTVRYWRQSEQTLSKRRAYWKQYDKTRRQPQTVIFRNADLRPRQNGVN